ncbi:MAG: AsmA family protein [Steroidobacteraceae bacterium]
MRALKIVAIAVGGLVALLGLVLVGIYLFIDPNDYKDRIAAAVQGATGRELSLPGDLKLSLFPWVALETGAAALGNPPGFGRGPFLSLSSAKLKVKLLPLLHQQLEVGRIEIDGLHLQLLQDAQGKGNWEYWGEPDAAPGAPARNHAGIDLAGITITNGRIAFRDMLADQVKVEIGRVAPGVAIPLSIDMALTTAPQAQALPIGLKALLTADLERQRYQFADLSLSGSVQPAGAPQPVAWHFATPAADLDLAAQTLARTTFNAEVGEAELAGSIEGQKLVDAPALQGGFELAEVAPRELMQQLGLAPPATRDSAALAGFAAQGAFAWQGGVARMTDLQLVLDQSKLAGRVTYDSASQGMDFALSLDQIDLDRYQPPPTAAGLTDKPIELPVDFLKPLRARGSFTVGAIQIGGAHLSNLSAGISIADAVARFAPLKAQLYGGNYSGDIGIDMRTATPRLTMNEHMSGIDIAALMKDFIDSRRLAGRGNLDVQLAGTGRSGDALLKTLTGSIAMNLQDGAVEGIDVWYAIAQAQSLIKNQQLGAATNTRRTAFETFKASADVVNGLATTNDLVVASQLLRITGAGSTNLVNQAINYNINAAVLKAPPGGEAQLGELERASIPVRVSGTLTEPKIRPDLAGLARERVKQEVEKRREEVEDKVKDKVRSKLQDLLKKN